MITATGIELRAGARLLLADASFKVTDGDKVGLVGRNGAGKTTLMRVLSGESQPAAGVVGRSGDVGYLAQDPRESDPAETALERILSARGLADARGRMDASAGRMASAVPEVRERAMRRYSNAEAEFTLLGGHAAESEAGAIASNLGLDARSLGKTLGALSGGQRRRVELARILFARADTLLLDEPTNHLDADSIAWLRSFLASFPGSVLMISHDAGLLSETANRVLHLDATRSHLDIYNMGWGAYLQQRETDERRRRRESANSRKQASALRDQAERMRAKATKAKAAQVMLKRADRLMDSVEVRREERVARIRLPKPAHCGRVPLAAEGLSRSYGSEEVFTDVDLAVDRGARVVVLGLNGAGKTTLLRVLAGVDEPDTGQVIRGHGLQIGYYAQEHERLDPRATVLDNLRRSAADLGAQEARDVLGSFLFGGDDAAKPAGVLSGGEKTRLALAMLVVSGANVLLLDEPTNNLDPASRAEILGALHRYEGAVVLVTHDEGAVDALAPQRVLLLPDGVEDHWGPDYSDLVALA
ncbi:MAG: ABC-F family ATP-binding cassette domain-containing protein [Candidatus Nanopelagicales bacterium]|nr:ABC-F family ATP-binding cassette domain-containing protein [Candidatus Nanopelagicales bacterium]